MYAHREGIISRGMWGNTTHRAVIIAHHTEREHELPFNVREVITWA